MYLFLLSLLSSRAPPGATSLRMAGAWQREALAGVREGGRAFRDEGDRWTATSLEVGVQGVVTLSGVQLVSARGRVEVKTESWGRSGALVPMEPTGIVPGACAIGEMHPEGTCNRRLELRGVGITEAWANTPQGFEQSWTVVAPSEGEGDLVLNVSVEGAEATLGDSELRLDGEDGETWLVSSFAAWDADGMALPIRLDQIGGGFRVTLDDTRARYPVEIDPVYGTAAATFTGEAEGDGLGPVSGIGDVNGDGYDDLAVAAAGYSSETGRVYVYFGSASGVSSASDAMLDGEDPGDLFGRWVSGAGDVNGDGYDDVIIGAYGHDSLTGRAYVYHGSASGLSDVASTTFNGTSSGDYFAYAVSGAGDVNSDGYDDVVVSAPESDDGWGRAYIYYGSVSGVSTSDATTLTGEADDFELFGSSVSGAGDVNGDGYDDVVIGAYGYSDCWDCYSTGRVYVFYGTASGVSTTAATTLQGESGYDYFGCSVSGAGDVDGDGYSDIVVGAYAHDYARGAAYVYGGSLTGISATATELAGEVDEDYFGRSVSGLGDVNGDGYDDLLIGALGYGDTQGRAYVYQGSVSGVSTSAATTLTGESEDNWFGARVSGAGDVNGDGYDDFLVGAPAYSADRGRAYLYLSNIDADGDGYLSVDDCDDGSASVYPGAEEVACDCTDQDCDGEDLLDGCDTADPGCDEDTGTTDTGDTGADTGETGTDSGDTGGDSGDSSPTDTADTDTSDTAPDDSGPTHSGGAEDTAPKTSPDCGCATPPRQSPVGSTSLLLSLLSLLALRRRSAHTRW